MPAPRRTRLLSLGLLALVAALALLVSSLAIGDGGQTPLDRIAFRALALAPADSGVAPSIVDCGEVTLALFTLVALGYLLWRRAFSDFAVILAGLMLCLLSAHILKSSIERPRPAGEIVAAGGFSFPSTTSALGVSISAIAIALSRLAPVRGRRPVIIAGLAASILLGLAFVALRVHYMSDVIAGWALGVLVFSLCDLFSLSLALGLGSGGP